MIGGVGTLGSYGLALWAMTMAPIAVVAALRETAILFGVLISALVLKEKSGYHVSWLPALLFSVRLHCACLENLFRHSDNLPAEIRFCRKWPNKVI